MTLLALDHVNLRTKNLDRLTSFYVEVLGLTKGPRPDFGFAGAWLYIGERAVVHLVGVSEEPQRSEALHLEHVAFRGTDLQAFVARLERKSIEYRVGHVQVPLPGGEATRLAQVNVFDPDGNHLHIDFTV
jgi:catechol 2,3-dioxygenase-like lactoylglutathione lyase family enzyme